MGAFYFCSVDWLAWCGLLINTSSLALKVDYTRYTQNGEKQLHIYNTHVHDLEHTCSMEQWSFFKHVSLHAAFLQSLPIFPPHFCVVVVAVALRYSMTVVTHTKPFKNLESKTIQ